MGRRTLLLLCLVWLVSGHDASKNAEWIFSYNGNISVYSSTSDHIQSQWGIDAVLTLQKLENFVAAQFSDVKTVSFNGEAKHSVGLEYRNIPEDAHALLKPFTIHYDGDLVKGIAHEPDDALWSVNMKRSIASFMQIDRKLPAQSQENNLYGVCKINQSYEKSGDTITLRKTFNELQCQGNVWKRKEHLNTFACDGDYSNRFDMNSSRTYQLQKQGHELLIKTIVAVSEVAQKTIYTEGEIYNIISQRQVFHLTSAKTMEHPIDFSNANVKTNLTFVQNNDITQGRAPWGPEEPGDSEQPSPEQINKWFKYARAMKDAWKNKILDSKDFSEYQDYTKDMLELMKRMKFDTINALYEETQQEEVEPMIGQMFYYLLPIVGTPDAIKYIRYFLVNHSSSYDIVALYLVTNFQKHTYNRTDEFLKEMEILLNIESNNTFIQQAGILSFAQIIGGAYYHHECSEIAYKTYINLYLELLKNAADYSSKLVYLEGLQNLRPQKEILWGFIQNVEESHHLRIRALYAIGDEFHFGLAFEMLWPMVKNGNLPFEMRVASLDILLRYRLNPGELQELIEYLTSSEDIEHLHLYNYFYTTVTAITKKKICKDVHEEHIEVFEKLKNPMFVKLWVNGNYRRGYLNSGGNHGLTAQAKLFGDPVTNMVTTVFLSFERFGMSLKYDSYHIHIKFEGLPYFAFQNLVRSGRSVEEVMKILSNTNLTALHPQETHLEFVLYSNKQAIFATQVTRDNFDQLWKMCSPIFEYLKLGFKITHPIINYGYFTSDFGTVLSKGIEVKQILKFNSQSELENHEDMSTAYFVKSINVRSLWSSEITLRSYNPIDNTEFSVTKFQKSESEMALKFKKYFFASLISWKNIPDRPIYHQRFEHLIYTSTSNYTDLVGTCPKCYEIVVVNDSEDTEKDLKTIPINLIGMEVEVESDNLTLITNSLLEEHLKPLTTYNKLDILAPFLLYMYVSDTTLLFANVKSCAVSLKIKPSDIKTTNSKLYYDSSRGISLMYYPFFGISNMTYRFEQTYENGDMARFWNFTILHKTADTDNPSTSTEIISVQADSGFGKDKPQPYRICLDVSVNTPEIRSDKFSMLPVDPTEFNVSISMGKHDLKTPSCPTENTVDIKGILTVLEDQAEIVEKAEVEPYRTCKADSLHYKYTLPSKSCIEAAAKSSTYHNYFFNVKMNQVSEDFTQTMNAASQYLEQFGIHEPITVGEHFSAEDFNVSAVFYAEEPKVVLNFNNYTLPLPMSTVVDFGGKLLMRPTEEYIFHFLEEIGILSSCIITPKFVKTFYGKYIWDYESQLNVNKIAYIDCTNTSRFAMLFNKKIETELAFSLYSRSGIIEFSSSDGEDDFSVTQDGNPVKYVPSLMIRRNNNTMEIAHSIDFIHFNKEYIHTRMLSLTMRSLCGLCSLQEENVSVKK